MALLTTWNENCGVATYSESLFGLDPAFKLLIRKNLSEQTQKYDVIATWNQENLSEVVNVIARKEINLLLIQYQPSFFSTSLLVELVKNCISNNIPVGVILHNVQAFCNELNLSDQYTFANRNVAIIVHSVSDLNLLKNMAPFLLNNSIHFPHPTTVPKYLPKIRELEKDYDLKISTFGFLHYGKGTDILIDIFAKVKETFPKAKLELLMARLDERSDSFKTICDELILQHGLEDDIIWNTEFLSKDEVVSKLSSSDLIILPYRDSSESASGAIRICLASGVPVVSSTSNIFSDLSEIVEQLTIENVSAFSQRVVQILMDAQVRTIKQVSQSDFTKAYSWEKMRKKIENISKVLFSKSEERLH